MEQYRISQNQDLEAKSGPTATFGKVKPMGRIVLLMLIF
jgi:hypothetical protein